MDSADDLNGFDNFCRLFPLPDLVFFPHAVLPLHIFEPRYRQMTEDALSSGDNLVTMVQLRDVGRQVSVGTPEIEKVACLGRIVQHQRLPDGRFNFLLLGLKRVRLIRELDVGKLYRVAEGELLDDRAIDPGGESRRGELVARFQHLFRHDPAQGPPDVEALLDESLPLGVLTDLMAHALRVPSAAKQGLLTEVDVARRVEILLELLATGAIPGRSVRRGSSGFPPPFSTN